MADLSLIKNWHEKAKEDYFSRYIFEYLAFEAYLKKYKYSEDEIRSLSGNKFQRSYIQRIKNESDYAEQWGQLISEDHTLQNTVAGLIEFLNDEPLISESNWWGCVAYEYSQCADKSAKGVVLDSNDFTNIVEFWYQVRNNLFHAGKNPDSKRDEILVKFGYATLSIFLEKILIPEMEHRTMVPASWEDFAHKFFTGKAEAQVKIGDRTACANVYELLFVKDEHLPILFEGKLIDRQYIIEKLVFNLINLYGDETLFREEWERIVKQATTQEQKDNLKTYFSEVSGFLNELIPDFNA